MLGDGVLDGKPRVRGGSPVRERLPTERPAGSAGRVPSGEANEGGWQPHALVAALARADALEEVRVEAPHALEWLPDEDCEDEPQLPLVKAGPAR